MSVKKVNIEDVDINDESHTTITITGDSLTTRTLEKYNEECPIKKLDAWRYKVKATGQVKHYNHAEKRMNYKNNEYSCAVKPHVRSDGNRQSGTRKPLSASLLA